MTWKKDEVCGCMREYKKVNDIVDILKRSEEKWEEGIAIDDAGRLERYVSRFVKSCKVDDNAEKDLMSHVKDVVDDRRKGRSVRWALNYLSNSLHDVTGSCQVED